MPCETPTRTREECVATQVVCEAHPRRAVPDAMSNAERLRRGLPLRSPLAARHYDGNGGRPDQAGGHPHGGAPGQNKDKDRDGHPHGGAPGQGKNRGGERHDGFQNHHGGHADVSCTPATVTVTTSTKTHHVPTQHTMTRTTSSCAAGPTETAPDCKTRTVDGPAVTKTKHCERGAGFTACESTLTGAHGADSCVADVADARGHARVHPDQHRVRRALHAARAPQLGERPPRSHARPRSPRSANLPAPTGSRLARPSKFHRSYTPSAHALFIVASLGPTPRAFASAGHFFMPSGCYQVGLYGRAGWRVCVGGSSQLGGQLSDKLVGLGV